MKEHEISTPQELETALAGNAMRKLENLWKAAEGRSFRWWDLIAALVGGLLALAGLYGIVIEQELVGAYQLAFGLSLLGFSMLRHQQVQIDALREIVRELGGRS
jgi:uncharacterized membrane protein YiaA